MHYNGISESDHGPLENEHIAINKNNDNIGCNVPNDKLSEIESVIFELEKNIISLNNLVDILSNKLKPILSSNNETDKKQPKLTSEYNSPLAIHLHTYCAKLHKLNMIMEILLNTMEL